MTDSRKSLSQSIRVQWFYNEHHYIAELLLKLALNTNQSINQSYYNEICEHYTITSLAFQISKDRHDITDILLKVVVNSITPLTQITEVKSQVTKQCSYS
jgi:hypothetical protein